MVCVQILVKFTGHTYGELITMQWLKCNSYIFPISMHNIDYTKYILYLLYISHFYGATQDFAWSLQYIVTVNCHSNFNHNNQSFHFIMIHKVQCKIAYT